MAASVNMNSPTTAVVSERLRKKLTRNSQERFIELALLCAALVSVFTTVAIVYILVSESWMFFQYVPLRDFLFDTQWTPLFADPRFGIMVLLSGTLTVAGVALLVSVPLGLTIAIYLSEFAPHKVRESAKPFLEVMGEGIPTIVYGFFALVFLTPLLQKIFPGLPGFNMLSAGLIVGVMIVPYIASLSEDAMRAVPMALREGSYAMGATRLQTALRVVLPAATSGVTASVILATSRALGETMVVAVAAGMQPNLTFNPMEPAATVTAFIVGVAKGDVPHGSLGYQTIFAAGLSLFVLTLAFNLIGYFMRKKFREAY